MPKWQGLSTESYTYFALLREWRHCTTWLGRTFQHKIKTVWLSTSTSSTFHCLTISHTVAEKEPTSFQLTYNDNDNNNGLTSKQIWNTVLNILSPIKLERQNSPSNVYLHKNFETRDEKFITNHSNNIFKENN